MQFLKQIGPAFFAFTALVFVAALAYLPTTAQVVSEWIYNGPYTHGLLAVALAFWIVWQERMRLTIQVQSGLLSVALMLLGGIVWLAGNISNTFLFSVSGQFLVLVGMCWQVFGFAGLRVLLPAIGAIALVLPIWGFLNWPLQQLSIWVTDLSLGIIGIPTLKQGIFFTVPGGRFAVEAGCSGLGFLLCSMLLAVVYSHFNRHSLTRSLRLFIFAIFLALVSNWIRIIIIMLVGNHTQMEHPIVTDHLTFGWVVFAVALLPFYWIANRLDEHDDVQDGSVEQTSGRTVDDKLETDAAAGLSSQITNGKRAAGWVALALLVPALSAYFDNKDRTITGSSQWLVNVVNAQLGRPQPVNSVRIEPNFIGASDTWQGYYSINNRPVTVLIVRYDEQAQGQELIFVENSVIDLDRWQKLSNVVGADGEAGRLEVWSGLNNRRRALLSWYMIGPYIASNKVTAKFYELLAYFEPSQTAYLVAMVMDEPNDDDLVEIQRAATELVAEIKNNI